MPIPIAIDVRLTRDRFDEPLAIIESPLGNGMAAYPSQLRELAAALLLADDAAEARPTKIKHFMDTTRTFPVTKYPGT